MRQRTLAHRSLVVEGDSQEGQSRSSPPDSQPHRGSIGQLFTIFASKETPVFLYLPPVRDLPMSNKVSVGERGSPAGGHKGPHSSSTPLPPLRDDGACQAVSQKPTLERPVPAPRKAINRVPTRYCLMPAISGVIVVP